MENNKEVLDKINSGNPELIAVAIQQIQENGDLNIAEELLKTLESSLDFHTTNTIVNLLSDIKDSHFRGLLIQHLQSSTLPAYSCLLLRIVWESSLDYSEHLDFFLQLLLHQDFTIAFEASTVIENMIPQLNHKQRAQLRSALSALPEDKDIFTQNILEEIENCSEEMECDEHNGTDPAD